MLLEIFSSIIVSFLGLLFSLFYLFVDTLEEKNWKKLILLFTFILILPKVGIIGFCTIGFLEIIMYQIDLFNNMKNKMFY